MDEIYILYFTLSGVFIIRIFLVSIYCLVYRLSEFSFESLLFILCELKQKY